MVRVEVQEVVVEEDHNCVAFIEVGGVKTAHFILRGGEFVLDNSPFLDIKPNDNNHNLVRDRLLKGKFL